MPITSTGPKSVPSECSCTWTWSAATHQWNTPNQCNTLDLKPNPPNYQGQNDGDTITTACIKPGGGGGDDEGMEEIEDVYQEQSVEQLGKQAADALMQLRKLAESGNREAHETLDQLTRILR